MLGILQVSATQVNYIFDIFGENGGNLQYIILSELELGIHGDKITAIRIKELISKEKCCDFDTHFTNEA